MSGYDLALGNTQMKISWYGMLVMCFPGVICNIRIQTPGITNFHLLVTKEKSPGVYCMRKLIRHIAANPHFGCSSPHLSKWGFAAISLIRFLVQSTPEVGVHPPM